MQHTSEMVEWAKHFLFSHNYNITSPPKIIQTSPWSSVTRFSSDKEFIFLKQTPAALSLEPAITILLHDQLHASVPVVIASNQELRCFLMKDAGHPLRETLKHHFDVGLLCQAIDVYTDMQYASAPYIKTFLELGVPDWRLDKLPDIYSQFIKEEKLLIDDGLTIEDFKLLHDMKPKFVNLCSELSECSIPETLDHADFHDNNILLSYDNQKITIIDLGEVVISHPFFSLINCLQNAMYRYSFSNMHKNYIDIKNACLKKLAHTHSRERLSYAFSLAEKLWLFYDSLVQYRLMMSCNRDEFKLLGRRGRLTRSLKAFISLS